MRLSTIAPVLFREIRREVPFWSMPLSALERPGTSTTEGTMAPLSALETLKNLIDSHFVS